MNNETENAKAYLLSKLESPHLYKRYVENDLAGDFAYSLAKDIKAESERKQRISDNYYAIAQERAKQIVELGVEVKDAMELLDKKGMAHWILEQALKGLSDE